MLGHNESVLRAKEQYKWCVGGSGNTVSSDLQLRTINSKHLYQLLLLMVPNGMQTVKPCDITLPEIIFCLHLTLRCDHHSLNKTAYNQQLEHVKTYNTIKWMQIIMYWIKQVEWRGYFISAFKELQLLVFGKQNITLILKCFVGVNLLLWWRIH